MVIQTLKESFVSREALYKYAKVPSLSEIPVRRSYLLREIFSWPFGDQQVSRESKRCVHLPLSDLS
jgi:hypothetical protein